MILLISLVLAAASTDVVVEARGAGLRSVTHVNGFDANEARPIQSYFLKPGLNALRVDYSIDGEAQGDGPWILIARATQGGNELVRQVGPTLTRTDMGKTKTLNTAFKLPTTLPFWDWMKSSAIANNDITKGSLYAEYQKLWATLNGMPSAGVERQVAFLQSAKAQMGDYIKAYESAGEKYGYVQDVIVAAAKGGTQALPAAADVKLTIFADGHLARLEPATFVVGELSFQAWYRKNKNTWELDALYPVTP